MRQDPTFRLIGSKKIWKRGAALTSRLQSFETEMLTQEENLAGLTRLNRKLVAKAEAIIRHGEWGWTWTAVRQAKPGRGGWDDLKPFVGTQRVTNPARKGWPAMRKRVLRGGGVIHPAKRRQRVGGPCD